MGENSIRMWGFIFALIWLVGFVGVMAIGYMICSFLYIMFFK